MLGSPARAPGVDVRLGARHEFTQFFAVDGDPDPTAYARGIPHLLRLMNSRQFAGGNIAGLVRRLSTAGRATDEVAGDLFLTILSRRPTADELQMVAKHLQSSESAAAAYREIAWALLMTSEFALNH
jgi:hypothetical protein